MRSSLLEARLSEARLVALKSQLNPHFLFNTLHSISALMHTDVQAADHMMARLGELLRLTLDTHDQEVTLHQELALLDRYLEIEKIRFEDRLRVTVDIDPAALDAHVPTLALQPLVENAIRHAIAPRAAGGQLEISAHRDNGSLRITIADDGPGLPEGGICEGVGLANTRARIEQLYGQGHGLVLRERASGGLEAVLTLPYREESPHHPTRS